MPATQLKLRRGSAAQHGQFIGSQGEITVVTDDWSVRIHDGVTQGGHTVGGVSALSNLTDVDLATPPTDGQALVYDSAASKWKPGAAASGGGGGGSYQVHRFLTSGTWIKPANLQFVKVFVCGPGSGGNSGSAAATNGFCCGGHGGWGGVASEVLIPADEIPDTVTVLVGAAGVGGVYGAGSNEYNGEIGTKGGSCRFGDLVYAPSAPPAGPNWQDWYNILQTYEDRTDTWYVTPNYGGSGGGNYYINTIPSRAVTSQWSAVENAQNNPISPAGGGSGATVFNGNSYSYGTLSYALNSYYCNPGRGGEGFTNQKPPIVQVPKNQALNWWEGIPWGRAANGVFNDAAGTQHGYSYDRELESLGGAGALTGSELINLKRKWRGCGGGGGAVTSATSPALAGDGGNGSFPGGGGGGGAGVLSATGISPGSGGNGAAGVVVVYSFIGSTPFAYL